MVQQTGETRDAIIEDDNRKIAEIIAANKNRREKYWIVLFAKPSKHHVDGKPVLIKHLKAYGIKPISQIGMVCGEVDPLKGTVSWEVNQPQRPFDWERLPGLGNIRTEEHVVETTTIADAYLTR
jgi:hypothetical protein